MRSARKKIGWPPRVPSAYRTSVKVGTLMQLLLELSYFKRMGTSLRASCYVGATRQLLRKRKVAS